MSSILSKFENKKIKKISFIGIIKIAIIIFMAVYLLGDFTQFYSGFDSNIYGTIAIRLVDGSLEYVDPDGLLKETGKWEYVPHPLVKTVHNTAVPVGGLGIYGISALSYSIGGIYGLFYLAPIFTIIFLVTAERTSSKLFGNYVGLATLVFLSTDAAVLNFGTKLLTDIPFAIFVLLGCYFIIKFLHERKSLLIFISSIFFASAMMFRLPGMIFFPVEISILLGYFSLEIILNFKKTASSTSSSIGLVLLKLKNRAIVKNSICVLVPWVVVFVILLNFNNYYFNEPFTLSYSERPFPPDYEIDSITSFFNFDTARVDWWLFYSVTLIPDSIKDVIQKIPSIYNSQLLGKIGIGIFTTIIWASALGISIYLKKKRTEVIVLVIFAIIFLLFYSGSYLHSESYNVENYTGPSQGNQTRHMLPILSLSLILFAFITQRILKIDYNKISYTPMKLFSKFFIYIILILIVTLLLHSMYTSISDIQSNKSIFRFKNPDALAERYTVSSDVLPEKSIIVAGRPGVALSYNAVPFFPLWEYIPTIRHGFDSNAVPQEPINLLKEKISEDYEIFVFKSPNDRRNYELKYYRYLESEHSLILKEYTEKFCKMELIEFNQIDNNTSIVEPDQECYLSLLIERGFLSPGQIRQFLDEVPKDFTGNMTIKVPIG